MAYAEHCEKEIERLRLIIKDYAAICKSLYSEVYELRAKLSDATNRKSRIVHDEMAQMDGSRLKMLNNWSDD